MYLGQGLMWAKQMPPTFKPKTHCDCGQPVLPRDFLCRQCRDKLEASYAQNQTEEATSDDYLTLNRKDKI